MKGNLSNQESSYLCSANMLNQSKYYSCPNGNSIQQLNKKRMLGRNLFRPCLAQLVLVEKAAYLRSW
ncbi:hypothetical protein Zm00014a_023212 [Zea mays]|jgi:hypothetical protein|uniref:Uncharacterized protein n=1 Tax=Zea mays TaxID=4577 RepID=A0A3L6EH23_MAIZE|nr:hypothetical protein Zm00014a_023212 [Zea mays]